MAHLAWRTARRADRASPSRWSCRTPCSASRACVSTSCAEAASRLPVGSSARISAGSVTMARAMATRCSWPPESCRGKWSSRSPRPTSFSAVVACSIRSCLLQVGQLQRQFHVLQRGQHRNQVELLEDEADVLVAPVRDLAVAQLAQVVAQHADLAAGGAVHGGDQVQQRGLAGARRPHQRHELALVDLDVDVLRARPRGTRRARTPWSGCGFR